MNASYTIKVPVWLDRLFTCPILLYRLWKYGYTYRKIYLGEGEWTILDQRDYYRLSKFKWYITGNDKKFYAVRNIKIGRTRTNMISMHREIMNAPKGVLVDHRNSDPLDNRRTNLRFATQSQNLCNSRRNKENCTSKFRGVSWNKRKKRWRADLQYKGKCVFSRLFTSEIEAAHAYDKAAKKYHGEFARLNFSDEQLTTIN
ncbi:MAG: HNH endonuclease [Sedimentisphaerales bacterium]|nr:HNH endonuclease [Sedimentisphaerales bacterium]